MTHRLPRGTPPTPNRDKWGPSDKGYRPFRRADLMVQPPGSSNLVGFTTAPMSVKVGDIVAGLPHVTVAFETGALDPFFNINTPDDLSRAESLMANKPAVP